MDKKIIIGIIAVFVIAVGAIAAFQLMRPDKPTLEEANVILAESLQNTLELTSFTTTGDGSFQVKDGETVILEVTMRDTQASIINPFDFANQDSRMAMTYDVVMNFKAIADIIEMGITSEELVELKSMGKPMGIDPLEKFRVIGEVNISVVMEMKSIDFDSYIKIVEVAGLREILTQVGGIFLAEMAMAGIEPYLGVWRKTPADPEMTQEMTAMFEGISKLIPSFFDIVYVRKVLPNTRVNNVSVYNFTTGMNLDKAKDLVISFASFLVQQDDVGMLLIDDEDLEKMEIAITENWPKVKQVIETIESDSRVYICQKTQFIKRETVTADIGLFDFSVMMDQIMREVETEVTPEEIAEFERMKEILKDIRIVIAMDTAYSDHNAVSAITPPAEYEVITPPESFRHFEPEPDFRIMPITPM